MSIYDALRVKLECVPGECVTFTFSEIEKILGRPLPRSAYRFSAWWGNGSALKAGHSQAKAWTSAGFRVSSVSLTRKTVEFHRISSQVTPDRRDR